MPPIAQVSTVIAAPPEDVWATLTEPDSMKRFFLGADVETDWREGSPITFRGEWKGKKYEDKGEIQTFDPPKRLSFSHWSPLSGQDDAPENYNLVTFDLAPATDGTRVTLTQSHLIQKEREPVDEAKRAEYEGNWRKLLEGLKQLVEQ